MANAGYTTLSTVDQTLLDVAASDQLAGELVFYNVDGTNDALVHCEPLHVAGEYLRIPHTPTGVAPVPVYVKGPNDKITKVTAKSSAATPILSWAVTSR